MFYTIDRDNVELIKQNLSNKLDILKNLKISLFTRLNKEIIKFNKIVINKINMDSIEILDFHNKIIDENTYIIQIEKILNKLNNLNDSIISIVIDDLEYDVLFDFYNLINEQGILYSISVSKFGGI